MTKAFKFSFDSFNVLGMNQVGCSLQIVQKFIFITLDRQLPFLANGGSLFRVHLCLNSSTDCRIQFDHQHPDHHMQVQLSQRALLVHAGQLCAGHLFESTPGRSRQRPQDYRLQRQPDHQPAIPDQHHLLLPPQSVAAEPHQLELHLQLQPHQHQGLQRLVLL